MKRFLSSQEIDKYSSEIEELIQHYKENCSNIGIDVETTMNLLRFCAQNGFCAFTDDFSAYFAGQITFDPFNGQQHGLQVGFYGKNPHQCLGLLKEFEKFCKTRGCSRIVLHTNYDHPKWVKILEHKGYTPKDICYDKKL